MTDSHPLKRFPNWQILLKVVRKGSVRKVDRSINKFLDTFSPVSAKSEKERFRWKITIPATCFALKIISLWECFGTCVSTVCPSPKAELHFHLADQHAAASWRNPFANICISRGSIFGSVSKAGLFKQES